MDGPYFGPPLPCQYTIHTTSFGQNFAPPQPTDVTCECPLMDLWRLNMRATDEVTLFLETI